MIKKLKKMMLIPAFLAAMYTNSFAKPTGNENYNSKTIKKENQEQIEFVRNKSNLSEVLKNFEKERRIFGKGLNEYKINLESITHNSDVDGFINNYNFYQIKTNQKKEEKKYNTLWKELLTLQVLDVLTTANARSKGYGELNLFFKDNDGRANLEKIIYGKSIVLGIFYTITKRLYKDNPKEVRNAITFLNTFYEYVIKNNIQLNTNKSKQTIVHFGRIKF